jgi:hypothetical protein
MRTIILNQGNLVQDGQNNKLVYRFPNSVLLNDAYLAVSSVVMFYSWYNITSTLNNNTFSYNWISGAGPAVTYTVNVPNGLYEIATLNQLLQFTMIQNGHYLVDSAGNNVYYAEFVVNPSRYAVQINTFLVPLALPAGYTNPAGLVFPLTTFNPIITLPANINKIFGYVAGFATDQNLNNAYVPPASPYVSKLANGTLSYISTTAPQVQPNSSVLLNISNIDNAYAQPTGIIYTVVPNVAIGEVISEKPPQFAWNKMINGTYNELRMNILGTDLAPITINDPAMTFILVIAQKEEIGG